VEERQRHKPSLPSHSQRLASQPSQKRQNVAELNSLLLAIVPPIAIRATIMVPADLAIFSYSTHAYPKIGY